MPDVPSVSVVIPTKNNESTLERLLVSIRDQTYPDVESIVVDNGSSDRTKEIAARYADVVLDHGPERSAQRNRGVEEARGRYIAIIDSDMVLEPQTVAECIETATRTGASAIVIPESTVGAGFLAKVRALERSCYEGDSSVEASRFFDRAAYLRFGGYDEQLRGPEDWDLPQRMRKGGEQIGRADGARILHDETNLSFVSHLRKKYQYGKSMGTYARRHPREAARQFSPVRPALVRHWRALARRPALGACVVGLKVVELAAGTAGLVSGRLAR